MAKGRLYFSGEKTWKFACERERESLRPFYFFHFFISYLVSFVFCIIDTNSDTKGQRRLGLIRMKKRGCDLVEFWTISLPHLTLLVYDDLSSDRQTRPSPFLHNSFCSLQSTFSWGRTLLVKTYFYLKRTFFQPKNINWVLTQPNAVYLCYNLTSQSSCLIIIIIVFSQNGLSGK
jgi:hypothetical protein